MSCSICRGWIQRRTESPEPLFKKFSALFSFALQAQILFTQNFATALAPFLGSQPDRIVDPPLAK